MKKIAALVLAAAFVLSAGSAFAAKVTCTVDAVDGEKLTMTCKNADTLKAGDEVTLKAKKGKAVEGC